MVEQFKSHNFKDTSLERIEQINAILTQYAAQGFSLTVRQLFYQLVARGLIENTMRSYKQIVALCTNAREAGLLVALAVAYLALMITCFIGAWWEAWG